MGFFAPYGKDHLCALPCYPEFLNGIYEVHLLMYRTQEKYITRQDMLTIFPKDFLLSVNTQIHRV